MHRTAYLEFPDEDFDAVAVARDLRGRLEKAGFDRADPVSVRQPDSRRRAGNMAEIVGLAVAIVGTTGQLVDLLCGWLAERRDNGPTEIWVRQGDKEVRVVNPATEMERRLIEDFIRRCDRDDDA